MDAVDLARSPIQSATACAFDAAVKIARGSSFRTLSHEAR